MCIYFSSKLRKLIHALYSCAIVLRLKCVNIIASYFDIRCISGCKSLAIVTEPSIMTTISLCVYLYHVQRARYERRIAVFVPVYSASGMPRSVHIICHVSECRFSLSVIQIYSASGSGCAISRNFS